MEILRLILVVALVLVAAFVGFSGPGRAYVVRRHRPERVLIEGERTMSTRCAVGVPGDRAAAGRAHTAQGALTAAARRQTLLI